MKKTRAKNEILNKYKIKKINFLCFIKKSSPCYISEIYKKENIHLLEPQSESVRIMTSLIEQCRFNLFGFYLFIDKNYNIYNCGSSGYFGENEWCLKHEDMQDFQKWLLSSQLECRPNTIRMVKEKITKIMANILDENLSHSSLSSVTVKKL